MRLLESVLTQQFWSRYVLAYRFYLLETDHIQKCSNTWGRNQVETMIKTLFYRSVYTVIRSSIFIKPFDYAQADVQGKTNKFIYSYEAVFLSTAIENRKNKGQGLMFVRRRY